MSFIKSIQKKAGQVGSVLKKSYGPLAALEPSKENLETLRYPLDVGNMELYPHTVEFMCWKPEPVEWSQLMGPETDTWLRNLITYSEDAGETQPYEPVITGDGWKSIANWRKLTVGMKPNTVEKILGSADRIEGGKLAEWYYKNGGKVTFYKGEVNRWSEPR